MVKEAIAQTPSTGQLVISVPRKDEKPSRSATLTIRHASFHFPPPRNRSTSLTGESIALTVISATEDNPTPGATPIKWLLLTTLSVNNFEDAVRCIRWYTYRASH